MMSNTSHATGPSAHRRVPLGFLIALTIVAGLVVFALAATGVGYLYLSERYGKAEAALDAGQYAKAMEIVSELPPWFKDTQNLMVYSQASLALQNGDYLNARTFLTQLGGFRDSAEMILETDYRNAGSLLDAKQYDEAAKIFSELAGRNYKDSQTMVLEVGYRRGLDLLEQEKWGDAVNTLAALGDYSDSADKMLQTGRDVLNLAVEKYRAKQFKDASELLDQIAAIPALEKDVAIYRTLIEAHNVTMIIGLNEYDKVKPIYDKLAAMDGAEDSQELIFSDPFFSYFLEGRWKDDNGKVDINNYFDHGTKHWNIIRTEVDLVKFRLKQYIFNVEGGVCYKFIVHSDESMTIQVLHPDGYVYATFLVHRVPS